MNPVEIDHVFEIEVSTGLLGSATAYADDAEGVVTAVRTLARDFGIQGRKNAIIRDLNSGLVIFNGDYRVVLRAS
jgi:hypothetical protein